MRYDYINIKGSDRFSVSGISGLTVRPTSRIQMILGKNGAGKSSLMTLGYTPFAPEIRFFPDGGEWEVGIHHRGSAYILKATYSDKVHYSFKLGDEELNRSRNVSTQNDLIKQHFGLTKEIQELITGQIQLTKLTPQARRDWMARLSESDFSFAFKALKHYTKKHSYFKSVTEYLIKEINKEKERLLDEDDFAQLKVTRSKLQDEYDELQASYNYPITESDGVTYQDLERSVESLLEDSRKYLLKNGTTPRFESDEQYDKAIEKYNQEYHSVSGQIEMLVDEIVSIQTQVGRIDHLSIKDVNELNQQLSDVSSLLAELPQCDEVPVTYLEAAGKAIEAIRYVMAGLPAELIDPAEAMRIRNEHANRVALIDKATIALQSIESNLALIKEVKEVNCPSCNHTFKPGIDPELFDKLNERRIAGLEYIKTQTDLNDGLSDLLTLDRKIEACAGELQMVRDTYLRQFPGLFNYLDSVDGWGIGKGTEVHLQRYESAHVLHHHRTVLKDQIEQLKVAIAVQAEVTGDLPKLQAQLMKLNDMRSELEARKRRLSESVERCTREKGSLLADRIEAQDISNQEGLLYQQIDNYLKVMHNRHRREELQRVTTSIAVVESALNENDVILTSIKDLSNSLEDNQKLEKGAKAIVDELSPKTGLIAEQIREQIGTVLNAMNSVIRKIWGYDLSIGIGEVTDGGLDYKLPLKVGGVTRGDISEGSSSMTEIINRAFVITAMICLGLNDYPLYQDEPAITFDTEHELNFVPVIKELIDTDQFSQLILISHDVDTQTAFSNAEYLVLGDLALDHISNPNEHVDFHYDAA